MTSRRLITCFVLLWGTLHLAAQDPVFPGLEGDGIRMAWEAGAAQTEMTMEMTFDMPDMFFAMPTGAIKEGDLILNNSKPLYVVNKIGWNNLLTIHKAIKIDNEEFVNEDYLINNSEGLILVLNMNCLLSPEIIKKYKSGKFNRIYYQIDTVEWVNSQRDLMYLKTIC